MVEVRVAGVALDAAQQHVILLEPIDPGAQPGRAMPVWIGAQEATSILVAVQGATPPRPLAHDLMVRLLEAVDARVERVEVTRLEAGTFYAEIILSTAGGRRVIDSRPSDAIALASRTGSGIWVADAVFEEAAVDDLVPDDETDVGEGVDDEAKVDEFRRFLDAVDPDDFQG